MQNKLIKIFFLILVLISNLLCAGTAWEHSPYNWDNSENNWES